MKDNRKPFYCDTYCFYVCCDCKDTEKCNEHDCKRNDAISQDTKLPVVPPSKIS